MPQLQETGPSPGSLQKCVAVYDNVAEFEDELAFRAGDILTVIEKDTGGLNGWWLCSLRGRQGICPGNRLRLVGDIEQVVQRRSWPNKVVMPQKYGHVYLYDLPRSPLPSSLLDQYQVPPPPTSAISPHSSSPLIMMVGGNESLLHHQQIHGGFLSSTPAPGGESYDTPRPLNHSTPSSSLSSLTTDSNRSSLVHDYDIPRPPRTLQPQQMNYDVPKEPSSWGGWSGGEVLEHWEAVDRLGKLEAEALSGVRGVVGEVGPSCTAPPHRLPHLRSALASLIPALHYLIDFGRASMINAANHPGLENKLKTLVGALVEADRRIDEQARILDSIGWDLATYPHQQLAVDTIISTTTPLTDDIRQLASFIQGNSTLLFKKSAGWGEDYDYVNLEGRRRGGKMGERTTNGEEEVGGRGRAEEREQDVGQVVENIIDGCQRQLDPATSQMLAFYAWHGRALGDKLTCAIDLLLSSVETNQPPRVFLKRARAVLVAGARVGTLAKVVQGSSVKEQPLHELLERSSAELNEVLNRATMCASQAASRFPSITAVQAMVDSVIAVSHSVASINHSMAAAVAY